MLGAAADGRRDLLGVGRGEDEHHVARRLLQRLQQRVGCRGGEHVDLVDDVHLPTSGCAEPGVGHEVAHGIDAVVRGGIELVHVEGAALGDLATRGADTAWLAVDRRLAVERLGQYPCRGRLARAPRTAEQIGMRHAVVADGATERPHHVVLTSELVESPRPKAPIKGDEGCVGHGRRAYPCARTPPPGARCGGQVGYGTRPYPLRAAAFRP